MIATALLLLVQTVIRPPPLVVRSGGSSTAVAVVSTPVGLMVRFNSLRPMLDASVSRSAPGLYTVSVFGSVMQLQLDAPVVQIGGEAHPLAAPPRLLDDQLYVPLQFVVEVLPTIAPNLRWDADARELVVFTSAGGMRRTPAAAVIPRTESAVPGSRGRQADVAAPRSGVSGRKTARVVVVDAGHGGPDNGMTGVAAGGARLYEKNVTLGVAKRVGQELSSRGVQVVYTRTTDTLIALDDRGRIANRSDGDLFLSIHVNAANPGWKDPTAARGFETYFLAEAKTEDAQRVAEMENDASRYESASAAVRDDALSFIITDMMQNEHLRESSDLAEVIQHHLTEVLPGPSRGVKQAGFRVLVTAHMPAVLVEIGFGSNPSEAALLLSPAKQQQIAIAVADGAMDYLQRYERRMSGSGQ